MGPFLYFLYNVIVNKKGLLIKIEKIAILFSKMSIIQLKSKQDLKKVQNPESFVQRNCKPSPFWTNVGCTTKMKPISKIRDISSQTKSLPT